MKVHNNEERDFILGVLSDQNELWREDEHPFDYIPVYRYPYYISLKNRISCSDIEFSFGRLNIIPNLEEMVLNNSH